ncbi:dihydroorotate dehydrogenase [Alkalihalobacillus oceani]|uniref:Dihydroorotate dehydrogenase n=1 Tax=Halalkalibacter oceani TaxID=1653776 RepID=A0A9X2DMJ5_9BACI|nr:dihydroorotate dehydrogenase [Halalkalibacter oceani]MCM3712725.1 dihydroorotate dehydrogenase [Halalkalibacter oceani]
MTELKLAVDIGGLTLKNPIMPASGAFGPEMDKIIDFNQLGALVPKSITIEARPGNATPRVCETTAGMINSIGIQSKGIEYYMEHYVPYYAQFDTPLIASLSAGSVDEFAELADILAADSRIDALELNISCPNLKGNGLAFGMDADLTYKLVQKVRAVTDKPIISKLTPNVTSIQEIAKAAEAGGSNSLNVANTLLAMAIDVETRKPKIGNVMGGLSGPAVKPIIVRLIYQVAQAVNIPIIGCGGVATAEDAIEMMLAGASAVQVGTASFIQPTAMIDILRDVKAYMERHHIPDIQELIGQVHIQKEIKEVELNEMGLSY